jgi:hypothetical protein
MGVDGNGPESKDDQGVYISSVYYSLFDRWKETQEGA